MRWFALAALVLPLLSACSSSGPSEPVLRNGRCTCDSGLCVQTAGTNPPVVACEAAAAGSCVGLSTSGRRCWGSPNTSGLCVCLGTPPSEKLASR